MPKIEVNEEVFYSLAGLKGLCSGEAERTALEEMLTCAKAELDEDSDKSLPVHERTLKIELNDTNRPDLWTTAGCARQLRVYQGGKIPEYPFFSSPGAAKKTARKIKVEKSANPVRPYLAGFIAGGKKVTDASLRDMIQSQEKLSGNFGRKRKTISMGLYRISRIQWPIIYRAVEPASVSFTPLQWEEPLTLREILKQHPKGKEYASILEDKPLYPLLLDAKNEILSFPPIINSADLGAVQVGDTDIFVELTGTDLPLVTLAASIMACDLADQGYTIEPVEVEYEYDTPFGRNVVFPYYFQTPVFCSLHRVERFLGDKLNADECAKALLTMGVKTKIATDCEKNSAVKTEGVLAYPPEYRNDYLHAADVMEDVMIGRSLKSFKPQRPGDFTIGRLNSITLFSRHVKGILTGMGFQEMIYNYLGSRKDLVDKMRGDGKQIIRIANPMTENYEYVRDSIIASLISSESVSGHAMYPHQIFEIGKIARRTDEDTVTRQFAGFLHADKEANFNSAAAQIQTLFYYMSREYEVEETDDPRFIPGRAAVILYKKNKAGVFGEIHPEVLENWGITVPCAACEIDLNVLEH